MNTQCHICNENIEPDATWDVKCKLCCDGLEQEFCLTCSFLYFKYNRPETNAFSTERYEKKRRIYFKQLQARRQVAVNRTRFKLIQGGK